MNVKGAEILAFYIDWPMGTDWYHDDGFIEGDEDHGLDLDLEYDINDAIGSVLWQGNGPTPKHLEIKDVRIDIDSFESIDLIKAFKAWRGDKVMVTVRIEPGEVEALRAVCLERGWSLVS